MNVTDRQTSPRSFPAARGHTSAAARAQARHRAYYLSLVKKNPADWERIDPLYGQIKRARHKTDERPLDPTCACHTCSHFSRAYLHHLERCGEMLAPMLASIHNLHYYLNLMQEVRTALEAGRFEAFRAQFHADRQRGID